DYSPDRVTRAKFARIQPALRGQPAPMSRSFGVDLRGIIELLSQHLYASPRVYVRELLQNAVDATTARGAGVRPDVVIETLETTGDGTLRVSDNGIGLTEDEVHTLLSTLGRTSKRDELGFA